MANDNNPFKTIEENFIEKQRKKQQGNRRTQNTESDRLK